MPFTMRLPFVGGTPRGRAAKGTAAVAAVAFAATLAVAPSANATGYNWQHWTPSGNCFAWTTWNANQVQGHVHNVGTSAGCTVEILQWPAPDVPKQASGSSAIPGTQATTRPPLPGGTGPDTTKS